MKQLLLDCVDELCLKCGKYENEHEGACDGCKWFAIKNGGHAEKYEQFLLNAAYDIQTNCDGCCQHIATDDYGQEYIKHQCPFFRAWDQTCLIGEPSSWLI